MPHGEVASRRVRPLPRVRSRCTVGTKWSATLSASPRAARVERHVLSVRAPHSVEVDFRELLYGGQESHAYKCRYDSDRGKLFNYD